MKMISSSELRDAVLSAQDIAYGFDNSADVIEALTEYVCGAYDIPNGMRKVRIFSWIAGFRPVPASNGEVKTELSLL